MFHAHDPEHQKRRKENEKEFVPRGEGSVGWARQNAMSTEEAPESRLYVRFNGRGGERHVNAANEEYS